MSGTIWEPGSTVNRYRTEITNQINAGDVFMGNFADLVVLMWGPGTERRHSNSRAVDCIITFQDIDLVVRRTESFCLGHRKLIERCRSRTSWLRRSAARARGQSRLLGGPQEEGYEQW